MMHELVTVSATTLARMIRSGAVTAEEVMQAHLARIAEVNPLLNALVASRAEQALAEARAADAAAARGATVGPLHGVPFSVKDWIDARGLPCTGADPAFRARIPDADATVVARMRAAGAILLGKTNALEQNEVYGRTHNPYNRELSPAGSSSGEAALIAAGGSPLGLGSDSGGSIRQPAHVCGIAGLKPTTGRVPLTGHFPFIGTLNDPRTVIGPMARYVEDLALALEVIGGPDWADPSVVPMPLADWQAVDVRSLRVAFYTRHAEAEPTAETEAVCRSVAALFAELGAQVVEALPPRIDETYSLTRRYWRRPESASAETWLPDGEAQLNSLDVEQHLFEWERYRRALIGFMRDYDVILTPAAAEPAVAHGDPGGSIAYTLAYSLTGWPAAVVRAGTTATDLPIGVQLVARPWRDDVALAAARAVEAHIGGWRAPTMIGAQTT